MGDQLQRFASLPRKPDSLPSLTSGSSAYIGGIVELDTGAERIGARRLS